MEQHNRRKRNAFIGGTANLTVGIILLVVRAVNMNNDRTYSSYYYYFDTYPALLISGIILIICGGLGFLYGLILQLRPPPPVPQTTCLIIPPGQGIAAYPPPLQQPMAGAYPTQPTGFMPGYQTNYPTGVYPPPTNLQNVPAGSITPSAGTYPPPTNSPNVPAGGISPSSGIFPAEPPPAYTGLKE